MIVDFTKLFVLEAGVQLIYMVASICIIVACRTSLPPFVIPGYITGQAYG